MHLLFEVWEPVSQCREYINKDDASIHCRNALCKPANRHTVWIGKLKFGPKAETGKTD